MYAALDLRPASAADTDEACPVAIGHEGHAQQDVLKVALDSCSYLSVSAAFLLKKDQFVLFVFF